ncbi:hypothetical protein PAMA_013461 [Pampus argenteus]
MAKVNRCLKRTFTAFNVFFAVVGAAIIGLALLSQILTNGADDLPGRTTGLIILYVVGIVTMVIAILGAYGAHEENRVALIVFLVCMVIGSLLTLRAGVPFAIARPTVEGILEDNFREFLPLDAASDDVKDMANTLQTKLHCCGLFSYEDWRQNIPDSCLCDQEEQLEGQCQNVQTVGYKVINVCLFTPVSVFHDDGKVHLHQGQWSRTAVNLKKRLCSSRLDETNSESEIFNSSCVLSQTCFPTLMHYTMLLADITIGVVFTLAALATHHAAAGADHLPFTSTSLSTSKVQGAGKPSPVLEEPSPVLEEEPSPVLEEEPSPVLEEPSPVLEEEPSPVLEEEPSPVLEEPSPVLEEEPSPVLEEEPSRGFCQLFFFYVALVFEFEAIEAAR